jgi:hypothetical protein
MLQMGKELAARLQSDEVALRQSVPIVSASMEESALLVQMGRRFLARTAFARDVAAIAPAATHIEMDLPVGLRLGKAVFRP